MLFGNIFRNTFRNTAHSFESSAMGWKTVVHSPQEPGCGLSPTRLRPALDLPQRYIQWTSGVFSDVRAPWARRVRRKFMSFLSESLPVRCLDSVVNTHTYTVCLTLQPYTHTHTHTHTRARARAHIRVCVCLYIYICIHKCIRIFTLLHLFCKKYTDQLEVCDL